MNSPRKANLKANLERIRNRIDELGGDPEHIEIVAVTKGRPVEYVLAALKARLRNLGESYAVEFLTKLSALEQMPSRATRTSDQKPAEYPLAGKGVLTSDTPVWHFIGNLQRNKVRKVAAAVSLWQSVWRLPVAAEIARRSPGSQVLIQITPAPLAGRGGCLPAEASDLLKRCEELGLRVSGLMAMAHPGHPEQVTGEFRTLIDLADKLDLPVRSIGTSSDWELAVREGSTMLRLGKTLFEPAAGLN